MSIPISTNFDLSAGVPIDSKLVQATISSRNAIPIYQRYEGMVIYVEADQTNYQLIGGNADINWTPLSAQVINVPSASWASSSIQSQYASQSLFSTQSISASYVSASGIDGTVKSASYALSASYVPNLYPQTYQASASWASSSISASYAPNLYPQITQVTVASSSWVSASVFIVAAQTASYVASASYYPPFPIVSNSSSWASASVSSSISNTAIWSNNLSNSFTSITDNGAKFNTVAAVTGLSVGNDGFSPYAPLAIDVNGNVNSDGWIFSRAGFTGSLQGTASIATSASYYPSQTVQTTVLSASWISASVHIINSDTASYVASASYYPNQVIYASSSWASASISSSYTPNLYPQVAQVTVASASWVSASVHIINSDTASYVASASYYPVFPTVLSASWVSASAFITAAQTSSYVTASNVIGTVTSASYAYSASYSPNLYPQITQVTIASASWVSASVRIINSDTASYVASASYYPSQVVYVSSSWSSASISASYAPVEPAYSSSASSLIGTKQPLLLTGTTYPITSSWALNSRSASYIPNLYPQVYQISTSYAPVQPSYSASVSTQFGTKQDTLTNTLYVLTASLATSASYYPAQIAQVIYASSSWASSSLSTSYSANADTSSYFINASSSIDNLGRASFANSTVTINDFYGLTVNAPAGFNDVATFNADVTVWGSLNANSITGSLQGTSSYADSTLFDNIQFGGLRRVWIDDSGIKTTTYA